jgi:hypothetical protein
MKSIIDGILEFRTFFFLINCGLWRGPSERAAGLTRAFLHWMSERMRIGGE